MRILHILDHSIPLQSGYTFRTLSILEQQRARGWETFHLTSAKHTRPHIASEEIEGWKFYRTRPATGLFSSLPVLRELALMRGTEKRLLDVIDEVRPDILHAHSPLLNAIPAIRAGRKRGLPVVYEVRAFWEDAAASHGTAGEGSLRYRATHALESWALRHADAVTTICAGLKSDIITRGVAIDKITVIPNAVDVDGFSGGGAPDKALATSLGLGGKTVLGFIGSFYSYEGLALMLDAMPDLIRARPDIRLLLVGGGPEDERLRAQAKTLGLADEVVFTGRVPHTEVQKYYDLVDILVYPRISMRLTDLVTPLKPLEAMALNKIIVASRVGGHQELIKDGETGNLFTPDDRADLVATILQTLDNRENWDRQRQAGRQFVEQERTWANSVANYAPLYERLKNR
jgi:PEP-CTERM/exosortase A-associated glycosyltransferase